MLRSYPNLDQALKIRSTYASVALRILRLNSTVISAYVLSRVGLRNDEEAPKNFCSPAAAVFWSASRPETVVTCSESIAISVPFTSPWIAAGILKATSKIEPCIGS